MTSNSTQRHETINDGDGPGTETTNILFEEVSTLQALYGDENITTSKRNDGSGAHMISINLRPHVDLEHVPPEVMSLSISVPADYPDSLPQSVTLSVSRMIASHAAHLVQQMLDRVSVSVGSQCLFDYCQTMLEILQDNELQNLSQAFSSVSLEADGDRNNHSSGDVTTEDPPLQLDIFHCEPFTERKSTFQAYVCPVSSEDEVAAFMAEIRSSRKGSIATHIMSTYRIRETDNRIVHGYDDDGEKSGGRCMHNVLISTDEMNIAVALARWFGGIKLGPARFRIIARMTREAIDAYHENRNARKA